MTINNNEINLIDEGRKQHAQRGANEIERIKKGIEAYKWQQDALLRLIRKSNGLTESKFDDLYMGREWRKTRKRVRLAPMTGDTFLLGLGADGHSQYSETLELIQKMMILGKVETIRNEKDEIVYVMPTNRH